MVSETGTAVALLLTVLSVLLAWLVVIAELAALELARTGLDVVSMFENAAGRVQGERIKPGKHMRTTALDRTFGPAGAPAHALASEDLLSLRPRGFSAQRVAV